MNSADNTADKRLHEADRMASFLVNRIEDVQRRLLTVEDPDSEAQALKLLAAYEKNYREMATLSLSISRHYQDMVNATRQPVREKKQEKTVLERLQEEEEQYL